MHMANTNVNHANFKSYYESINPWAINITNVMFYKKHFLPMKNFPGLRMD